MKYYKEKDFIGFTQADSGKENPMDFLKRTDHTEIKDIF